MEAVSYAEVQKEIKRLEKQDKRYQTMARNGALDPYFANEAREIIQKQREAAKAQLKRLKKLKIQERDKGLKQNRSAEQKKGR